MDRKNVALIAIICLILGIVAGTNLFQIGGPLGPAPTLAPSHTATNTATSTATFTPTLTSTPSNTPRPTATSSSTPMPTVTPSDTPTNTPTYTPTATPTNTPTHTSTPTSTPTKTPIPPAKILKGVQDSGQLITVISEMAEIKLLEVRYRANYPCEYSAKHAAVGVIEAGINLEEINEKNIKFDVGNNSYSIFAPAAAISSCRLEEIDQYIQLGGGTARCFANEWMDMEDIARHLAMELFVKKALGDETLERAEKHAEYILGNLIRELTGTQVDIMFADRSDEPFIPDSCQIALPLGWNKDSEGRWIKTE
jgi:hypothetical protein